jgi:hypothetical protein
MDRVGEPLDFRPLDHIALILFDIIDYFHCNFYEIFIENKKKRPTIAVR